MKTQISVDMTLLRLLLFLFGVLLTGCSNNNDNHAVGTLEWDRVEVVSEAAEPIIEVLTREGDLVKQGDIILRLDTARQQAQHDEAKAVRAEAAARLAEAERGPRLERIRDARAALKGAEETLTVREREYHRLRELEMKKLASPGALDQALSARDIARTQRDRARAQLQELETGTTTEELEQARQALARADAAARVIEVKLNRLTVRAPVDGRVDSLPYKLGEQPPAGNVVAVMLSGNGPYARVYVPEAERVKLAPGTPAQVFVDGIEQPFPATIRTLASDPSFTPYYALTEQDRGRLTYIAEVDLDGDNQNLPAGVPVEVLFLPTQASEQ